jgi:nucleotide-binding universal stress UspA family protein
VSLGAPFLETADNTVREFLEQTAPGSVAHIRVMAKSGGAVTGILEQAQADSSDLIVMGTRGRTELAKLLLEG